MPWTSPSGKLPTKIFLHSYFCMGNRVWIRETRCPWSRLGLFSPGWPASYPDYSVFVAEVGSQIVGTFALLIMDNLAHRGAKSGIVEDVVVDAARRGQGVGKVMMRFALEHCQKKGCYKLVLSSNEKREATHRFYESLGFTKHGFSFQVELLPR